MTFQFKIQLRNVDNLKVYWQVQVPTQYIFYNLHKIIQEVIGWENANQFYLSPEYRGSNPQTTLPNSDAEKNIADAKK